MAIRILTIGTTHIQYNDTNYNVDDTVGNPVGGYFNIKTTGGVLVVRIYNDRIIYWHTPPAAPAWEAIGSHLKVTLP